MIPLYSALKTVGYLGLVKVGISRIMTTVVALQLHANDGAHPSPLQDRGCELVVVTSHSATLPTPQLSLKKTAAI